MVREVPNIDGLVCVGYLSQVSEDISASETRINLWIAALKPCWWKEKRREMEKLKMSLALFDPIFFYLQNIYLNGAADMTPFVWNLNL